MTLKDKKNKREYNRKQKAEGVGGASGKSQEKASSSKRDAKSSKVEHVSNFSGVKEDSAKLLSEANQKFMETEIEKVKMTRQCKSFDRMFAG